MCMDMSIGICTGMCIGIYVDMCADMCIDTHTDMCVAMCIDMEERIGRIETKLKQMLVNRVNMCIDISLHRHACRGVYRHVCIRS